MCVIAVVGWASGAGGAGYGTYGLLSSNYFSTPPTPPTAADVVIHGPEPEPTDPLEEQQKDPVGDSTATVHAAVT